MLKIKSKLNLHAKLIGFLTKKGNKNKAKIIVNSVFRKLSFYSKRSTRRIFLRIFSALNVFVEARKIRIKRRSHVVPFAITLKRRSYLIVKWIMKAVNESKKKDPIAKKVYREFVRILKKKPSKALKIKKFNDKQVLANRSNMHFRW